MTRAYAPYLLLLWPCFCQAACTPEVCDDPRPDAIPTPSLLQAKANRWYDVDNLEEVHGIDGKAAASPAAAKLPVGIIDQSLYTAGACGVGTDVVSTKCLGDSLVKAQAEATVRMRVHKGYCTAFLVKAATSDRGAMMMSTGHCGKHSRSSFEFNYVGACPMGGVATDSVSCMGTRRSVNKRSDEQAIYELDRPCAAADAATPILLDIGQPDLGEGVYIIGHPKGKLQVLSHQEVHDRGHHCDVVGFMTSTRGSQRVSYFCDTLGGSSGSPVFSARTGHCVAVNSHGGCDKFHASGRGNSGGLFKNHGFKRALDFWGIPYVDRRVNTTDLFKYENFVEEEECPDHEQNTELSDRTFAECKAACVNSLTCVGVEFAEAAGTCSVNYRSAQKRIGSCPAGARYWRRTDLLTTSLLHAPGGSGPDGAPECKDMKANRKFTSCGKLKRKCFLPEVKQRCPVTCGICSPGSRPTPTPSGGSGGGNGECVDRRKGRQCRKWKKRNKCLDPFIQMQCAKTCGVCE